MTRDEFRKAVFERDKYKCVICGKPAVDAHHIIERKLWLDGGYYLDNGASLCGLHHLYAEWTIITVEVLRHACGITNICIPPHFHKDVIYDKWGNIIMPDGTRLRGELFYDESVQKILGEMDLLDLFRHYVKYPRTHHVPWSLGINDDDHIIDSMEQFNNKRVIITEKMDGENTTMYSDHIHARSVDSRNHSSRNWVKNFWSRIAHDIPDKWRICGENLYAKHSIHYQNLSSYFLGFSIWDENNTCLNWDDTLEWFEMFGIIPVPIIYDGIYDESYIKKIWNDDSWGNHEGYVIRIADSFSFRDFKKCVAKFVRKNHIQTVQHWLSGQVIVNKIA